MNRRAPQRTLRVMSSCAPGRSEATRVVGGSDWRCSSTAESWRGLALGRPPRPRRPEQPRSSRGRSVTSSSGRWQAWRWHVSQAGDS
jgi:hypothetical protein